MRRGAAAAWLLVPLLVLAAAGDAAAQYQAHLRFRVVATEHFRLYYHQGEVPLARRLAGIAEQVWSTLPDRARLQAPAVTHVVLANQDDVANGLATPLPYCTVRINAAWPALSEQIGNTDDWLRLVFVHEYTHVLQLDQSAGWARLARRMLGRSPVVFPNLFLPEWQVEGLAVYWESEATGLGRLTGGDTADVVRGLARPPGGETIDRVNGGLVDWPGGLGPYLEGGWFYAYLVKRFGSDQVARVAGITAGRVPYLASPAFARVFGESLGDVWKDFQRAVRAGAPALPQPAGRRLTREGFDVTSPRIDDAGRTVVYSAGNPDGFPAVLATDLASGTTRAVVDRFGGSQLSVRAGTVVYDQVELSENVAWRSDLFAADLRTGRSARLTHDARLLEPDLSPDGRRLACVRVSDDGTRRLAFFTVERTGAGEISLTPWPVPIHADAPVSYGAPRWSPDGRRVAVERRRLAGPSEIVVFDVSDGRERVAASSAGSRNIQPAWMPDGRAILFASDRFDQSFQVLAAFPDRDGLCRVLAVEGGAMAPDVSPDGRSLVYVGSDATGHDLFEAPLDPARWEALTMPVTDVGQPAPGPPSLVMSDAAYSPVATLLPRSWTPLADTRNGSARAGFDVGGADVLGRHAFEVTMLWRLDGNTGVAGGARAGRPDWTAGYVYSRWRPAVFVAASDTTSFLALAPASGQSVSGVELRQQGFEAGVTLPLRRVRYAQVVQAAFNAERDTFSAPFASAPAHRNAVRLAWALDTAKTYGRSISAEDGVAAGVTSEQVRSAFGADGDADAFTADLRGYLRPFEGHEVLAARVGYGVATGDPRVRRQFYLGGTSQAGSLVDFGSDAFRMLRGFDNLAIAGRHVAVGTLEWRQPVRRIERGWGTVPVFVGTIHGAVFIDAGDAWDAGFSVGRLKASIGAEASVDLVVGYRLPITLTAGAAVTRDGAASGRRGSGAYVRLGPSF
jgi:Tol biopolymer transport system component